MAWLPERRLNPEDIIGNMTKTKNKFLPSPGVPVLFPRWRKALRNGKGPAPGKGNPVHGKFHALKTAHGSRVVYPDCHEVAGNAAWTASGASTQIERHICDHARAVMLQRSGIAGNGGQACRKRPEADFISRNGWHFQWAFSIVQAFWRLWRRTHKLHREVAFLRKGT